MAIPSVSAGDLASFHARHFSTVSLDHFSLHFLGPVEEEYFEEAEDDGLGYYADGKKRTLTDEQIAIFRHSEIQALLRERRHAQEAKDYDKENGVATPPGGTNIGGASHEEDTKASRDEGDVEEGELDDDSPVSQIAQPALKNNKAKKAQRGKERGYYKQHVKPDLRKRTWDVVEKGVGSLDYDEDKGGSKSAPPRPAKRRQISYDD